MVIAVECDRVTSVSDGKVKMLILSHKGDCHNTMNDSSGDTNKHNWNID